METTDRKTARAIVAVGRSEVAIVAEVQAARAAAARRSRPTVAVDADKVETAIVVVAITRSRIPDGLVRAKLAGEVHTFVGAVVCSII